MIETLWREAEIIVSIIQSLIIGKFLVDFNEFSLKTKANRVRCLAISSSIAVTIILFNYLGGNFEGVLGMAYPVLLLMLSLAFFKTSFLRKLFGALTAVAGVMIANTIVLVAFSTLLGDHNPILTSDNIFRVMAIAVTQVILFVIYKVMLKLVLRQQIKLSAYEWLITSAILFFTLGTYVSLFVIKTNESLSNLGHSIIFFMFSGLILVDGIILYIVFRFNKINAINAENKQLKEFYSAEQKYATTVKTQYEELRRIRHDIKQLIETVSVIAVAEGNDSILNVLDTQKLQLQKNDVIEATNNIYVNAILTAKISEARAKSIKVNFQMTKEILDFDSLDLCYLLGNLLDNAIESCVKCTAPAIQIKLLTSTDTFEITIKNSVPQGYKAEDLVSSKADKHNHGFGLKSIRLIVSKYNGMCDFYIEEDSFISFILLKSA
jgi:sensor histidine kinase YesM